MSLVHPVYGPYMPGWKIISGFEKYEVNDQCVVRHIKTQKIIAPVQNNRVGLYATANKRIKKHTYHLALLSFFPHIKSLESVDHIDENRNNNNLNNLQWMTRCENTTKSNHLRPRNHAPKQSKPVDQFTLDGQYIQTFKSMTEAGKQLNISGGNIAKCANGNIPSAYGFKWKSKHIRAYEDLPNEIWKTSDKLISLLKQKTKLKDLSIQKIRISNLGRIQNARGMKSKGTKEGIKKYRTFVNQKIHLLVWAVFGDRDPGPREHILHDDSQPLDEDGCVSNAIAHLRLGTARENAKECWAIGTFSKKRKLIQ